MKIIIRLLIAIFLLSFVPVDAQKDEFKKERKRTWRKWRKNKQSYNPYLEKKDKDKPSVKTARADKKELKKQKRVARKEMRKSKRKLARSNRKKAKG